MAKPSLLAPPTSNSVKPTLIGDVSAGRAAALPPPVGAPADVPPAPPPVLPPDAATGVAVASAGGAPAGAAGAVASAGATPSSSPVLVGVVPSATDCVSTLAFGPDTRTGTTTPAASMP